ncbi:ATPase family AAA domain-containing protein 5-like [Anneissia japonica]|uniref:ATPase family AAA domain-containing protein 5-like n=1 Tax=Anneissia japonica TaxID=1529436 RepID=UPI001425A8B6|nr:ATPase family AAA domain-containing protein 5-like [Anneissia japonica]XP_033123765.1 ATPase family AAA domain-containing protein 5-like [Anneissia japonica]XP_033123766.1 ATPase family AAA domain-containing protein 5-like [Anneissia japonica]XP_033123767.1 ATPase family AAA domain-containing protein 5-like [Anneissia japonica]
MKMIGLMESSEQWKPANNTEPTKDDTVKICTTLDNFFKPIHSPPSEHRMSKDLRSYFSTSPPTNKTKTYSQKLDEESTRSIHLKSSETSKRTLNNEKSKPGKNKRKNSEHVMPQMEMDNKNEVHVISKVNGKNGDRKLVSKPQKQARKCKTGVTKTKVMAVNDDGDGTDVANCSFVSFDDFLGDETKLENPVKNSVNKKDKKQEKRSKNATTDRKSSGDKEVKLDDEISKSLCTEDQILPALKKSCKTVVVEIHSSVSSTECEGESKNSPQRSNSLRGSNVVVDSGKINLSEIEVVQSDIQKNNELPFSHTEFTSSNTRSFPIFQKNTQQGTVTDVKPAPVFSIFEKKRKNLEKEVVETPQEKTEDAHKRKLNKIEKESDEHYPRKRRKKAQNNAADLSTMSIDEFVPDMQGKESIKKSRKKQKKRCTSDETSLKLRRSTRAITNSTPKKEFEVESAIWADGTIRMRIRAKKNTTSSLVRAKSDVKTVTASKLLKKAKGQSVKASTQSCNSVAMKLKSNQSTRKQTGKQTAINQDKNAKTQRMASIFTKGGRKNVSMKTMGKLKPGVSLDLKHTQSKTCADKNPFLVLDEESLKARRAFLNRDAVPDVHKQTNNTINVNDLQEPPLPSIQHILQKDTNPLWNIPKVNLKIRTMDDAKTTGTQQSFMWNIKKIDNAHQKYLIKDFSGHSEFSYETQRTLLNKLSLEYPKFPVRRIFKRYLAKCRGHTDSSKVAKKGESDGKAINENKPTKRKSALPVENEDRKKRRKIPENEGKSSKTASKEKKTKDLDKSVRPVRQTRKKGTVAMDDKKEEMEKKDYKKNEGGDLLSTEKEDSASAGKADAQLWTEKYQPTSILELIGNQGNMKKLQSWLTEWKKLAIREKRKIKKEIRQNSNSQGNKEWWIQDDDSDYEFIDDFDSDDDDDEYDGLCNTKILVGPSGVGKTAAVYACASELGFKVFEVNASNRRTGKQILTDLGEATQSHHVARQSVSGPLASFLSVQGSPKKLANPAKTKVGIQNFFKPTATQAVKTKPKKLSETCAAKVPPAVKEEEHVLPIKKITSTSLIFFKDVDIVFEEDKGFVAAINSFMETTKRPIIMTTSDPTICYDFSSHSETLHFRSPSVDQLAVNLQLICLAENVLAQREDLIRLANLLNCDVRRCITALQYWVGSGAGISWCAENLSRTDHSLVDASENQQPEAEFRTTKDIKADAKSFKMEMDMNTDLSLDVKQHSGCFESTIGLLNLQNSLEEMFNSLQEPSERLSSFCNQCELVSVFSQHGTSIIHNNLESLLPWIHYKEKTDKIIDDKHKRKSDKIIDTFSALAEDMSFMDACCSLTEKSKVITGLSDLPDMADNDWQRQSCMSDIIAAIQVASFQQCRKNIEEVGMEIHGSDDPVFPVGSQNSFKIQNKTEIQRRSMIASEVMYELVTSKLPLSVYTNQRSLGLDYYPSLRNICQNEKLRKELQKKRRYLHYLDSISMVLKENTHVLLATSLQTSEELPTTN